MATSGAENSSNLTGAPKMKCWEPAIGLHFVELPANRIEIRACGEAAFSISDARPWRSPGLD